MNRLLIFSCGALVALLPLAGRAQTGVGIGTAAVPECLSVAGTARTNINKATTGKNLYIPTYSPTSGCLAGAPFSFVVCRA